MGVKQFGYYKAKSTKINQIVQNYTTRIAYVNQHKTNHHFGSSVELIHRTTPNRHHGTRKGNWDNSASY